MAGISVDVWHVFGTTALLPPQLSLYEPHIAPKIEQWAQEFLANREARRKQRAGLVPVSAVPHSDSSRNSGSGSGDEDEPDAGDKRDLLGESIELQNLVASEVHGWRRQVNRSQSAPRLRRRGKATSSGSHLEESAATTSRSPFVPMSPTHVIFDPSLPSTPTSTIPSIESSPAPRPTTLQEAPSLSSTLLSLSPPQVPARLPTPPASSLASPAAPQSPPFIPSLSQSYPADLEHEHGLEFLSAPSSRAESPFVSFSRPISTNDTGTGLSNSNYYSFSSPTALSPPSVLSPLDPFTSPSLILRPPSRSLSDVDLMSDFGGQGPLSPGAISAMSFDEHLDTDDEEDEGSDGSGSSWASTGARSP
ncbi:hypothetical protein H0H81_003145 [Sphagnurus paluster]|uniref:Uncharacterized protein n=1 Tax=Sphagnurus paluster TaxID=117069 RepID=A0A9P7K5K2_9AGAR|nr:hypothetical protein H0H81_003145 [Sphagnurus paluster]